MSMEGCSKCFRILLIIINVLFFIIGTLMFSFGAALKANPIGVFNLFTDVFKEDSGNLTNALSGVTDAIGIFMVVVGCVVAALAIWGIIAAILMNTPMLIIYAIVVIFILLAEVALIIVAVVYPKSVDITFLEDYSKDDVYFYNSSSIILPASGIGRFWYLLQNKFSCCGFRDYTELKNKTPEEKRKPNCSSDFAAANHTFCYRPSVVPSSCCKKVTEGELFYTFESNYTDLNGCLVGDPTKINTVGCLDAFYKKSAVITIAIAAVTLGILVLSIVSASCAATTKSMSKF